MAASVKEHLEKVFRFTDKGRKVLIVAPPGFDQEALQNKILSLRSEITFSSQLRAEKNFSSDLCFSSYNFLEYDPLDEDQPAVIFLSAWDKDDLKAKTQLPFGEFPNSVLDEFIYFSMGIPWVLRSFFKEIANGEVPKGEELQKKLSEIIKKYFSFLESQDPKVWPLFVRLLHCRVEGDFQKSLLMNAGFGFSRNQIIQLKEKYFEIFNKNFERFEPVELLDFSGGGLKPLEQIEAFRLGLGPRPTGQIADLSLLEASQLRDPHLVNWLCEEFFVNSTDAFHFLCKARSFEFLGFPDKAIEVLKNLAQLELGIDSSRARLEIVRIEYYRKSPKRFLNLVQHEIKNISKKSPLYPLFSLELHRAQRSFNPKLAQKILDNQIEKLKQNLTSGPFEIEIKGRAAYFEGFLLFQNGKKTEAKEKWQESSSVFLEGHDWRSYFESELNVHVATLESVGIQKYKEKYFQIKKQLVQVRLSRFHLHLEDSEINIAVFEGNSLLLKIAVGRNEKRMLAGESDLGDHFNLSLVEKIVSWLIEFELHGEAKVYLDRLQADSRSKLPLPASLNATSNLLDHMANLVSGGKEIQHFLQNRGYKKILKENSLVKTTFLHLCLFSGSNMEVSNISENFIGDTLSKAQPTISDSDHLIYIGAHALLNLKISLAEVVFKRALDLAQKWGNVFHQVKILTYQCLLALAENRFQQCQELISEIETIDKKAMHLVAELELTSILPVLLLLKKNQPVLARMKTLEFSPIPSSVFVVNRVLRSKGMDSIPAGPLISKNEKFYDSVFNILFPDLAQKVKVLSPLGSKGIYLHESPKLEPARTSFIYDETKKEIWVFGVAVGKNFTSLQRKILLYFLENQTVELSKENICQRIWQEEYNPPVHDSRIYTAINRLRRMLAGDYRTSSKTHVPRQFRNHVKNFFTVTRNGYVFELPGDWVWLKKMGDQKDLTERQLWILSYLEQNKTITRHVVQKTLKIGLTSAKKELGSLVKARKIKRIGNSKATQYTKNT